jgi:serine/threonine protein kinase
MEGLETERSRRISLLALDVDLINEEPSADLSYSLSENAFRQDGVSIGTDYLRIEGVTVTRGALVPSALQMQHDVLGRGAFSIVRRAVWKKNGREEDCPVAVKEWSLHGDASRNRRQMLIKELTTLRQLDCPNLLGLHGAFLQEDGVTMVLEYMDRGSLQDWLQKNNASGKSGPDECFLAAASFQMLLGLSYLHERRCLHRDMKPANVLMHSNGAVKLCDFGLASLLSEQSCNATVVGTTSFMAPERLRAQPYGRASDIWALGLVLATCCTGEMPFRNVTSIVELLVTIEETATTDLLPENTSAGLREIFLGCLQVEPCKY